MNREHRWTETIDACLQNGDGLLADAESLRDWERFPTAFALAVLAQEEFAKSFILHLVARGVIQWGAGIRRLLTHHHSKHLVGVLMEWLAVPLNVALERARSGLRGEPLRLLPEEVAFAINILRHEKLESLLRGYSYREPEWSGRARKLGEGTLEREKQAALYVAISPKGRVQRRPHSVSKAQAQAEIERAPLGARARRPWFPDTFAPRVHSALRDHRGGLRELARGRGLTRR